jgi:tetratricopeptide (TPR) repeat protein
VSGDRRRFGPTAAALAVVALPFAVALVLYAPVREFPFVDWDDGHSVVENPILAHGLSLEGIRMAFEPWFANWIPLTWLSYALDRAVAGEGAGAHHVVNVLWHAATAALLGHVLVRAGAARMAALCVALVFAVHPLRVESVAWVSERKDVLSGFFFVATVGAWLAYGRRPSAARWAATLVALVLGLLSKSTGVTLPFVLLLLDFWPLGRLGSGRARVRAVAEKIPFFAIAAATAWMTAIAQREGGAVSSLAGIPLDVRAANAVMSYAWYLEKAFWPTGLAAFYPHPLVLPPADAIGRASFGLAAATLAALLLAGRRPWWIVGWLWFLGTLVPMIGLVQAGMQARADRYAYLPLIGLQIAVTFEAWAWLGRSRTGRAAFATATAAATIALGVVARAQIEVWRDTETLFTHALAVTDENYLAHEKVGRARLAAGDTEGAMRHFGEALRINPRWPATRAGLAEALWARGLRDEAIWNYREAVRLDRRDPVLRQHLTRALLERGWTDDAIREAQAGLAAAAREKPSPRLEALLATAQARRGEELQGEGRDRDAIAAYRAALRARPEAIVAKNNLAWLLAASDDASLHEPAEALRLAEAAAEATQRSDASVLDTLAVALAANGRFEEAVAELDAALALLGPAAPERVAALRARRDAFVQRRPFVETRPDGGAAPTRP